MDTTTTPEPFTLDDWARTADALRIAWNNALETSRTNRDPAIAAVMQGMAGAYSQTLEKVEAILDQADADDLARAGWGLGR